MIYGLDYSPVLRYGIPSPKDGGAAHQIFWEKEIDRIINGWVTPHGVWIPGNYYFYLNYGTIMGYEKSGDLRKKAMHPIYRDGDHEFFQKVHDCRQNGLGLIVGKSRRRGYSWMAASMAVHEFILYPDVQLGIGSEGETDKGYIKEFRAKTQLIISRLPNELRPNLGLENNKFMLRSGYTEKIDGEFRELGLLSTIHWANFANPDSWRGLSLSMGIWEEFGEISKGKLSYLASRDCFKEGDQVFGFPLIGGTSNKIRHDNTDFQEMYNEPETYGLDSIFLEASKCYYPFYNEKTGISDVAGAKKRHEQKLLDLKKASDSTAYWSYKQEWPLEETDMWLVTGGTKFPIEMINDQVAHVTTNATARASAVKGRLEWKRDEKTDKLLIGEAVEFIPDDKGNFIKTADPLPHLKNAHCGAYDPYFLDDTFNGKPVSDSKAAFGVYRRYIDGNTLGEIPAITYHHRPFVKSDCYEDGWKMAVFYDCQILAEAGDDEFFRFMIDNGAMKYLKRRPKSADAPNSKVENKFGIHMKNYQKRLGEELTDKYIKQNVQNVNNLPLLKEWGVYGIKNTDIAMMFMLCLIHDMDMTNQLVRTNDDDESYKDLWKNMPKFVQGPGGRLIDTSENIRQQSVLTGYNQQPIKRGELNGKDRFNYGF